MLIYPMIFEEWKDIDFFDIRKNTYKISNIGRVYSNLKGGLLSPALSNGYYTVQLVTKDGKRKTFYVHRLVATAFVPNEDPDTLVEVNHKNLRRDDHMYTNLEWVTKEENIEHELANQGHDIEIKKGNGTWGDGASKYGENNGMAKLTESQVRLMLSCLENGMTYTQAILEAGLEPTNNMKYNLSHIARGHRWKYLYGEYKIPKIIPRG